MNNKRRFALRIAPLAMVVGALIAFLWSHEWDFERTKETAIAWLSAGYEFAKQPYTEPSTEHGTAKFVATICGLVLAVIAAYLSGIFSPRAAGVIADPDPEQEGAVATAVRRRRTIPQTFALVLVVAAIGGLLFPSLRFAASYLGITPFVAETGKSVDGAVTTYTKFPDAVRGLVWATVLGLGAFFVRGTLRHDEWLWKRKLAAGIPALLIAALGGIGTIGLLANSSGTIPTPAVPRELVSTPAAETLPQPPPEDPAEVAQKLELKIAELKRIEGELVSTGAQVTATKGELTPLESRLAELKRDIPIAEKMLSDVKTALPGEEKKLTDARREITRLEGRLKQVKIDLVEPEKRHLDLTKPGGLIAQAEEKRRVAEAAVAKASTPPPPVPMVPPPPKSVPLDKGNTGPKSPPTPVPVPAPVPVLPPPVPAIPADAKTATIKLATAYSAFSRRWQDYDLGPVLSKADIDLADRASSVLSDDEKRNEFVELRKDAVRLNALEADLGKLNAKADLAIREKRARLKQK